jgi:hypothetical protein
MADRETILHRQHIAMHKKLFALAKKVDRQARRVLPLPLDPHTIPRDTLHAVDRIDGMPPGFFLWLRTWLECRAAPIHAATNRFHRAFPVGVPQYVCGSAWRIGLTDAKTGQLASGNRRSQPLGGFPCYRTSR